MLAQSLWLAFSTVSWFIGQHWIFTGNSRLLSQALIPTALISSDQGSEAPGTAGAPSLPVLQPHTLCVFSHLHFHPPCVSRRDQTLVSGISVATGRLAAPQALVLNMLCLPLYILAP